MHRQQELTPTPTNTTAATRTTISTPTTSRPTTSSSLIEHRIYDMTNYIATVKIRIDPQAYIDSKYYEYKKSFEAGKSATEANLSPPTEAEIKLYVRNLVSARFPLDKEITHVAVLEVSPEDESESEL